MIKFNTNEQVIDMFNAANLWLEVFQSEKDKFCLKMECFDDPSHLMIQLDYYCERHFNVMLYNIRLCQAIKWYINNGKTLTELNTIINGALQGNTSYLVLIKPEEDEIPF